MVCAPQIQSWAFVESPAQSDKRVIWRCASSGGASSGDTSSDSASSDSASSGGVQPDGIKQGRQRRMRRPRPWSPYLHRRSTAYGRARCAGCWRTSSRSSPQLRWPPVRNPHPCSLRLDRQRGRGWTIFPHNAQALAALGLDSAAGTERRIEAVSARLNTIYQSKRPDQMPADTRNRYEATHGTKSRADTLRNIADYALCAAMPIRKRILARTPATSALAHWPVPNTNRSLPHDSMCVTYSTHTMPCRPAPNQSEHAGPSDGSTGRRPGRHGRASDRETVGRIDRMETRVLADGGRCIRLIDYKTGRTPTVKQIFNDLQLVCYQQPPCSPKTGRAV